MRIVGIHNGHDPSAALVIDGEVAVFIEEERLNRHKHGVGILELREHSGTERAPFPHRSLRYCLDAAGLSIDDLDAVVITHEEPGLDEVIPIAEPSRVHTMPVGGHHLAHAYGAFYASPFDRAVVVVYDHSGSTFERGTKGELRPLSSAQLRRRLGPEQAMHSAPDTLVYESESVFHFGRRGAPPERLLHHVHPLRHMGSHGLGAMYAAASIFADFYNPATGWDEPGKLMGLSGYGRPLDDPWGLMAQEGPDFDFDRFASWLADQYSGPRADRSDVAHEAQRVLEHCALALARWSRDRTDSPNLCITGGVGLNVHANRLIERAGLFESVFVMPCCSDAGNAIGAAFWWAATHGDSPRPLAHAALGRTYPAERIARVAARHGSEQLDENHLCDKVATLLDGGRVVGWFQGGAEAGPRALGHRSLLADPRSADMRDHLNIDVKGREPFRPLAPAVCHEDAADWFDLSDAPYMLRAAQVHPHRRATVPAVVHVDGSARPQTVAPAVDPLFHALIRAFQKKTGVPLLLNTSFNGPGQPIVETPEQAVAALWTLEIDALVLHDHLLLAPDVCAAELLAVVDWEAALDRVLERPRLHPWLQRQTALFCCSKGQLSEACRAVLKTCTPGRPEQAMDLPRALLRRVVHLLIREGLLTRPDVL